MSIQELESRPTAIDSVISPIASIDSRYRYDLTSEEFSIGQQTIVDQVRHEYGDTVCAVWIPTDHPHANLVRTLEAKQFPEIPDIMDEYENVSAFLALVDTREGADRIVHAFRISGSSLAPSQNGEEINIAFIKDIVNSGQGLTYAEVADYYRNQGVDLNKCISVETNFRVGERTGKFNGLPVVQAGYLALFNSVERQGVSEGGVVIFAHLNKPAVISLAQVGIEYDPVVGRDDLQTPTVGEAKFDDKYKPVAIPASVKNLAIFRALAGFAAAEIQL